MNAPTNPLFEEEKAFLERKKLEYERALRGDVTQLKEQIKEQASNAGRIATVGAGLAGTIWLITKALGGSKRSKKRAHDDDRAYADSFAYPAPAFADDEDADYDYTDYADYGPDAVDERDYFAQDDYEPHHAEAAPYRYEADRWQEPADYFDQEEALGPEQGAVYHSASDTYDDPAVAPTADTFGERNLQDYPAFAELPVSQPFEPAAEATAPSAPAAPEPFQSEAYGHPDSALPFDDSRRLPESADFGAGDLAGHSFAADSSAHNAHTADSFADDAYTTDSFADNAYAADSFAADDFSHSHPTPSSDQYPGVAFVHPPKRTLGSKLVSFAKSDIGKMVLAQAASVAMTLANKAIKEKLQQAEPDTAKTSDLAASTGQNDGYAHGHPATPQPDATTAPALDDAPAFL